jgi:hypothetical protein
MPVPDPTALTVPPSLAVVWRAGRLGIDGGRIELTDEVADSFRTVCAHHLQFLRGTRPRPWTPEADLVRDEEHLVLARAALPPDQPLLDLLAGIGDRDPLEAEGLPGRALLLHAYVFPDGLQFLRKANPHLTARTGHLLTRLDHTLTRIEHPVFTFDEKVDIVVTPDELLISGVSAFELLFKDERALLAHIPEWIDAIARQLPVNDQARAVLTEHCRRSTRLRRRLETIAGRGHLQAVTLDRIRREAEAQGLDPDRLVVDGRLQFDHASVEDLLRLLNEDLLIGGLSGSRFTVEHKIARG